MFQWLFGKRKPEYNEDVEKLKILESLAVSLKNELDEGNYIELSKLDFVLGQLCFCVRDLAKILKDKIQ